MFILEDGSRACALLSRGKGAASARGVSWRVWSEAPAAWELSHSVEWSHDGLCSCLHQRLQLREDTCVTCARNWQPFAGPRQREVAAPDQLSMTFPSQAFEGTMVSDDCGDVPSTWSQSSGRGNGTATADASKTSLTTTTAAAAEEADVFLDGSSHYVGCV